MTAAMLPGDIFKSPLMTFIFESIIFIQV
jgi:hypothetical protein